MVCLLLACEDNNLFYFSVSITDSDLPEMVVFAETPQKNLPDFL